MILRDHVQPAAVDIVGGAHAVAGTRRAQEDEEVRQLFGRGEAADRRVLLGDVVQVRLGIAVSAGGERGGGLHPVGGEDQAGVDAVDADVVADQLVGQALGEHHQRRLGDVVDRLVAERLLGADRGVVEDHAAAALAHERAPAARDIRTAAITCRSQ